tara:strand:+ start:4628 stop:5236 length:609 start_codon:yes stop_codon:yes gene_type:complete
MNSGRRIVKKLLLLMACCLVTNLAIATTIYKSTDAQGNTVFSSKPMPGAKAITINEPKTYDDPQSLNTAVEEKLAPAASATSEVQPEKKIKKATVSLTFPAVSATVWKSGGAIMVQAKIKPALTRGQSAQLTLNNSIQKTVYGPLTSGTVTFMVGDMPVGLVSATVSIIDNSDGVAKTIGKSDIVSFYVRQQRSHAIINAKK